MIINKKYVGKSNTQTGEIHYYLIQKDSQYGIELMEVDQEEMTSSLEWISENQEETRSFVEMLCPALAVLKEFLRTCSYTGGCSPKYSWVSYY